MSGESDVIARHEQGDRVLSGGTDAAQLAETMERHAPEPATTTEGPPAGSTGGDGASQPVPALDAKPTRGQARFSELAKARDAANAARDTEKARADAAEARAKELEARVATPPAREPEPPPQPAAAEPAKSADDPKDPEPQEGDFEDYRQFVKALSRWEIRQDRRETEAAASAAKERDAETARAASEKKAIDTWFSRRDAFAEKDPSFSAKAGPLLDSLMSGTLLGDAIIESEFGPQMALHLATHPEEITRISGLSVNGALRALGKIEMMFESPAPAPRRAAPTPPPAPYQPVNGNSGTTPVASSELAGKGHDFDASGYREKRRAERQRAGR